MYKIIKKGIIISILIILIFSFGNDTLAVNSGQVKSTFSGDLTNVSDAKDNTITIISSVLSVTRIVAAAVALVILMVIGCKYILASAGDRADIKKYAVNYVIGAIILFGASGILSIIKTFVGETVVEK